MEPVNPKLIALDVDGTILDIQAGVPVHKKVRKAVKEARKAGAKVCLSSARPCYYMQDATDGLDDIDALIGCSGATIEVEGNYLYKVPVPKPALIACLETARRMDMYVSFAGDEKILVSKKGPVSVPYDHADIFRVMEDAEIMEAFKTSDFYIAFIFTKMGVTKEEVFADPGFDTASIHKSSVNSFNITSSETDKGRGVLRLAEYWGIPREEVLAVGNDGNDIPMLKAAGTGAAVANADPLVIEAADWTVPDVRQGGAAEAIKRFMP